jgi:hypothetical protein
MADSLARGQWMQLQLAQNGIPGEGWDSRVAAMLVGSLLCIPERAPGKLTDQFAERLQGAAKMTDEEATGLLHEFENALEVYIHEQS